MEKKRAYYLFTSASYALAAFSFLLDTMDYVPSSPAAAAQYVNIFGFLSSGADNAILIGWTAIVLVLLALVGAALLAAIAFLPFGDSDERSFIIFTSLGAIWVILGIVCASNQCWIAAAIATLMSGLSLAYVLLNNKYFSEI